jgi:hypothetical protein
MPSILTAAATRVNAATAGLTGQASIPSQEPGAPAATTPSELVELAPTEFGGLTHIFSGSSEIISGLEPVNTAKTIPTGSVPGRLGGLAPDFRKAATAAVGGAKAVASPSAIPLTTHLKNTVASARQRFKI